MWSVAIIVDFLHGAGQAFSRWLKCQRSEFPPGGSGTRAPAGYRTIPNLPLHTIFAPVNLGDGAKLPLLVWANGGGLAWGLMFSDFLREIASHGYIIVANGEPKGWGATDEKGQLDAVEWALRPPSGTDDIRAYIDTSRIALAGQSKGGVHTYAAAAVLRQEPRIKTIGLFNSGLMSRGPKEIKMITGLTTPVYFFVGGTQDVLYKSAGQDWKLIPKQIPAYFASLTNVGHMGTYCEDGGGLFAVAAVNWLDTELKGDESSKKRLLEVGNGWLIHSQNL
jgi:hypothetical protein